MKEPTRWLDDPDVPADVRSVLGAAGAPPAMSPHAQATLAALAAGLAAHGAALPAAAAGSSVKSALAWLSAGTTGKAVAIVSLMGAIGSGSYVVTRQLQQRTASVPGHSAHVQVASRAALSVALPSTSVQQIPATEPTNVASAATAASAATRLGLAHNPTHAQERNGAEQLQPSRSGTAAFDELSIADEARLLEQARASLSGNPERALEIARAHQILYPAGQLSAEREFIVVDALLRLGRRQEAEQRAAPRLQQSPNSLYARRLRQLLLPKTEQ